MLNTEAGSAVSCHLVAPDAVECGTVYEGYAVHAVPLFCERRNRVCASERERETESVCV